MIDKLPLILKSFDVSIIFSFYLTFLFTHTLIALLPMYLLPSSLLSFPLSLPHFSHNALCSLVGSWTKAVSKFPCRADISKLLLCDIIFTTKFRRLLDQPFQRTAHHLVRRRVG